MKASAAPRFTGFSIPFVNKDPKIKVGFYGISEFFQVYDEKALKDFPGRYSKATIYFWDNEKSILVKKDVIIRNLDIPEFRKALESNKELASSKAQKGDLDKIGITVDPLSDPKHFDRLPVTIVKGGPSSSFRVPAVFDNKRFDQPPVWTAYGNKPAPHSGAIYDVKTYKLPLMNDGKAFYPSFQEVLKGKSVRNVELVFDGKAGDLFQEQSLSYFAPVISLEHYQQIASEIGPDYLAVAVEATPRDAVYKQTMVVLLTPMQVDQMKRSAKAYKMIGNNQVLFNPESFGKQESRRGLELSTTARARYVTDPYKPRLP